MKKLFIYVVFFNYLFALNVVSLQKIPGYNTKIVKSFNDINFSKSVAVLPADYINYVIKHKNIRIIGCIGRENGVIVSHCLNLAKVNTIANANLAVKIILSSVNNHYKAVNASYMDFVNKKVDAIYLRNRKIYLLKSGKKVHFLSKFIYFPKYILIGNINYLNKHRHEIKTLNFNDTRLLFNSLLLSKYYYKSRVKFKYLIFFKAAKSQLYQVIFTPTWRPFVIKNGNHINGIGIEFWKLIAKKTGIGYYFVEAKSWSDVLNKIKNKQADVTPNTAITKEREKYAYFSKPYISFPLGIVCKGGENIKNIDNIKSLAVGEKYTAEFMMKKHYPNLHYIEVKNTEEALNYVKGNKAQCAVDILPTVLWYMDDSDLKLYFKTPFKFYVRVMVNKNDKKLLDKINKAIDSISNSEKKEIISKYYSYVVEKENHIINKWLLIAFIIIIFSALFWIKKLKRDVNIDRLTHILNRGAIDNVCKKEFKERPGSIIFMDIDKFKKINDKYGHDRGDFVLKEFVKIIQSNIRKSDYFARWGGEEFLLLLPYVEYDEAIRIAEKLRINIEKYKFGTLKVTSSFGVTSYNVGDNIEKVMKKVDEALYEAKTSGRNKVVGKK